MLLKSPDNTFYLQQFGDTEVSGEELHEILKEIDTNMNGQVELDEYLQVRACCVFHEIVTNS